MLEIIIAFVLGLSVMFFGMATWFFARKVGKLSVVVAVLMALLGLQCLLSVGFIVDGPYLRDDSWRLLSSIDIVAVPFYATEPGSKKPPRLSTEIPSKSSRLLSSPSRVP